MSTSSNRPVGVTDTNISQHETNVKQEASNWCQEQEQLLKSENDAESLEVLHEYFDNGKNVTHANVEEFISEYYTKDDIKEG